MSLRLSIPNYRQKEIRWIASFIFNEMLGIEIDIEVSNENDFILSDGDTSIHIANIFFSKTLTNWLALESLPTQPLKVWQPINFPNFPNFLINSELPIIFGDSSFSSSENSIALGLDIFGSAFFMLSRYEELVIAERDQYDRFPAAASLAQKENFLSRPIVDEYVEILRQCIKKLFPKMELQNKKGEVLVTCDVDAPYDPALKNYPFLLKEIKIDIFKHRNFKVAAKRFINFFASGFGNYTFDPNNTFDWYMEVCEKNGHTAAFYFIPDNTAGKIDGCYNLNEKYIQNLIKKITSRGHEIGMHASFNTYDNPEQLKKERQILSDTCRALGIAQKIMGNRQHFLRFNLQQTPNHLEQAGFEYDTTGGFADAIGFRFGTSHTFSMWNWITNEGMKLKQKPLILMEVTVFNYMKLDCNVATLQKLKNLKINALRFGGDFTLLWHNDKFFTPHDKAFFELLISSSV